MKTDALETFAKVFNQTLDYLTSITPTKEVIGLDCVKTGLLDFQVTEYKQLTTDNEASILHTEKKAPSTDAFLKAAKDFMTESVYNIQNGYESASTILIKSSFKAPLDIPLPTHEQLIKERLFEESRLLDSVLKVWGIISASDSSNYKSLVSSFTDGDRAETTEKQESLRGRPKTTFKACFLCSPKEQSRLLPLLHQIIEGKKGKDASLPICVCIYKGILRKPTIQAVKDEFGDIGNNSGYYHYLNKETHSPAELEGMEKALSL